MTRTDLQTMGKIRGTAYFYRGRIHAKSNEKNRKQNTCTRYLKETAVPPNQEQKLGNSSLLCFRFLLTTDHLHHLFQS